MNFAKRTNLSPARGLCFLHLLCELLVDYQILIKCSLPNSFVNRVFVFKVEEGLEGEINDMATTSNSVLNWVPVRESFCLKARRYIATHLIVCAVIVATNIANST